MRVASLSAAALLISLTGVVAQAEEAKKFSPEGIEFFEKEIRPLLVGRCQKCHGAEEKGVVKTEGGLRLTSREALMKGGDSGPGAVAGKPKESIILEALRYDGLKMPPDAKLSDAVVAKVEKWIEMGLPWPSSTDDQGALAGHSFQITEEQRKYWAFQPVKVTPAPAVKNAAWPQNELDRYILAGLEREGLAPAPTANKQTLLRRVTFDLTGLPPTPEELAAFVADDTPQAYAKVVDRLLASPRYGERWGRHWLDVVRYTDSFDSRIVDGDSVMECKAAWRYRDYVVDAFNNDLPYDRFIREQIAGDLLPGTSPGEPNRDGIIATTMLSIGDWGGGDADKEKLLTDIVDDQINVVSRGFLGLTLACARCHDHKFDPISTEDYYAMAGIFFSSHILPDVGPKTNGPPILRIPVSSAKEKADLAAYQTNLKAAEARLKQATDEQSQAFAKSQLRETARYLLAAWDYRNRKPEEAAKQPIAAYAQERGLLEFALARWVDHLGAGPAASYRLLNRPVRDAAGNKGVHTWRGEMDCPNLLANTTAADVQIGTLKVPPRSVAMHPGPNAGVALAWKSPFSGTVKLTGRVIDADPVGGDGILWNVELRTPRGVKPLANGGYPNGGSQPLAEGENGAKLTAIEVQVGDSIELLVLPKGDYGFDTTVCDITIAKADGSAEWNLAKDVLDDPLADGKGNPHADRLGNSAVWSFWDMVESRAKAPPAITPLPERWQTAVAAVAAGGSPERTTLEQAAKEYQEAFDVVDARSPFYPAKPEQLKLIPAEFRASIDRAASEFEALKKNPPAAEAFAHGVREGGVPGSPHAGVHDVKVHVRGRYDRLGKVVPRRFPEIVAGASQSAITKGSGRLELANWIASPTNPLTARVWVNRVWQQHFGEGIVRSAGNFGKLGERPSHPELLDWLAAEFIKQGWSTKALHRTILLSATYQQSSVGDPASTKRDPDNRWFGRMIRRRLEAEPLRDSLLMAAGRLDETRGGPAVRDLNSTRRTLYLMTIRSDRANYKSLFDGADPTMIVDRRTTSTVAPQALFLLNHPFAREQAKSVAKRAQEDPAAKTDAERIQRLYLQLYGRPATDRELAIGQSVVATSGLGWEEYCQVLLCANEFAYVD